MKHLLTAVTACCITAAAAAQTVTIKFNGDSRQRMYEVVLNGTSYYSNTSNGTATPKAIVLDNLQPGTHSLVVYRLRTGTTTRTGSPLYTKDFTLRSDYNMNINVNGNGAIAFAETRIRNRGNRDVVAMTSTTFNQLLQTVNSRSYQSSKLTTIRDAFNTKANYFTTEQVRQLLTTITNENSKLELAKLAYARIVDPANIESLYTVFSYQSTRDNFDTYVTNNLNTNIANRNNTAVYNNGTNTNSNTNTNTTTRVAISSYDYNQLLQTLNNTGVQSNRYTTVYNAFTTGNYTFSAAQVRGLLALISSETDRLYLAKQSYARVSDPNYFSTVYDLFPSVNARTELNAYVVNNGGVNTNVTAIYTRTPMTDASFNQLLSTVQNNYYQAGKVAAVRDAFNTTSYVFTTTQTRQLLNVITSESDRLALAKMAYARVANPADYAAVYGMLPSQAAKNDLDYYIRNGGGNVVMSGSETVAVAAVSDAAFSAFKFDLKLKLFRSAKVAAVKEYINTPENYFTVEQVKELVGEGSAEADKIAIAKLAYRKTVDRTNYSQIVSLIPSANGKADLTAYINANQ